MGGLKDEKVVAVATMDTGGIAYAGITYTAVAETELDARLAIARRVDQHLIENGEENRERMMFEVYAEDDPAGPVSTVLGEDLERWADVLDDYHGMTVHHVLYGEARAD